MNAVCPACGIAVVPGYVRCPKCRAGLPLGAGRTKRTTADPGGTAVVRRGFPISAVLVAVGVAAAIILVFGTRRGTRSAAPDPAALPAPVETVAASAAPPVAAPLAVPAAEPPRRDTAEQDRRAAARELEATLRRQRLWGRAEIAGPRIDVRSGSCADRAMPAAIDGERAVLHGANLTRLRCLAQSGAVVFERDL